MARGWVWARVSHLSRRCLAGGAPVHASRAASAPDDSRRPPRKCPPRVAAPVSPVYRALGSHRESRRLHQELDHEPQESSLEQMLQTLIARAFECVLFPADRMSLVSLTSSCTLLGLCYELAVAGSLTSATHPRAGLH
eukprot:6194939-Pleurochrysis_carterae.AAC.2